MPPWLLLSCSLSLGLYALESSKTQAEAEVYRLIFEPHQ